MNDAQRENTRAVLKDLFTFWDARAESYGDVLFCAAAATAFDGPWRSIVSFFLPMQKEGRGLNDAVADYRHFKLVKGILPMDGARTILSDMVEKDRLCVPGLPDLGIEVSSHTSSSKYFLDSGSRRFPVGFPCHEFVFNIDHNHAGSLPGGAIYHPDLPLFPSGKEAVAHFFDAQLGDTYNSVSALVPDYRGKIREVRIASGGVTVRALCAPDTNLIGKLYSHSQGGVYDCADLRFDDGIALAKISDIPRNLLVVLLSRKSGELIDQRQFLAGSVYRNEDVVIEAPEVAEQDLEQAIQMGESETLEFKREIPPNRAEIAISATGFANGHSGRLLIGVAKDCQVVGCSLDNPKDTIAQILRSYCDPPLAVSIAEVSVRGLPIIMVTVPEGPDKPYSVRDKGVYIRVQGTTRIATRYEIDEMYRSKGNPYEQIGDALDLQ